MGGGGGIDVAGIGQIGAGADGVIIVGEAIVVAKAVDGAGAGGSAVVVVVMVRPAGRRWRCGSGCDGD